MPAGPINRSARRSHELKSAKVHWDHLVASYGTTRPPCGAAPRGACWIFTSCSSTWRSTVVVFREVDMVEVREVLRG